MQTHEGTKSPNRGDGGRDPGRDGDLRLVRSGRVFAVPEAPAGPVSVAAAVEETHALLGPLGKASR
jgi:hypothetical protein